MNKCSALRWGLVLACGVVFGATVAHAVENDPDLPRFAKPTNTVLSKDEFMTRRAEGAGLKRGLDGVNPVDPKQRISAISVMQAQQAAVAAMPPSLYRNSLTSPWTEIGPNPIPNAQVVAGPQTAGSGRTIAITVHPTDPNLVYVGTAQGGLYRSTNGGAVWTPMMDNALSLAIETIAIAPSQPDTIFVGTGESGFSADSFFGVGYYRIDNASSASPIITGPFGGAEFTGRSISKIVVHPTDANTIFITSASGIGGIGGTVNNVLAARGVFRSTNALSAVPTFTKLTVAGLAGQDRAFADMVMDPGNPDLLLVTEADSFGLGEGGVYRSINALSAAPTFARTFTAGVGTNLSRTELALHRSAGGVVTVYAASGLSNGTLHRSIDGGATWTQTIANSFCNPQCFYDIAVAVDPTNAATVYLGGSPTLVFGRSTNSGATFTNNAATASGLHGDSHAIAVAPSLPSTIYFGSDGGIYKSIDGGSTWVSLNNTTFRATQFMSVAVHPVDPNFSIGGTQDNGTNFYKLDGSWFRADFGDGGYALIDQSSTNTTMVNMYHTYFNSTTLKGYAFVPSVASATEGAWTFRGCNGSAGNGIPCGGAVLFYAPLEQGPGSPNTVYYGANILYRSSDTGLTHTAVSQNLTTAISAIGISPQNDNVRIVGQANGGLFGTTTGSATLTNLDTGNVVPNNFIARAVIDPNNVDTAYVTLSAFGVSNVWRTTNLSNATPIWTAVVGSGANVLPQVPVSAFLVDPINSAHLYAGTDIGVYVSTDGGVNWLPFGTGLPRVAVFDMAKTSVGLIRIATHGRGMWQLEALSGATFTPFLATTTATLVSESFLPANGVIDPGETVTVAFGVQNNGNASTVSDVGTLQATGGVTAPGAAQNYGVVVNGGAPVSRNFTFTAAPALTCGANFTATVAHQDGATSLGNLNYTLLTGVPTASITTSYTGPQVAIPDAVAAGVNIPLTVSGVAGLISDVNFRLDAGTGVCDATALNPEASVTHTFVGDLRFTLTSPSGTTVSLIAGRGGAGVNFCTITLDDDGAFPAVSTISNAGGVNGSFKPESPLAAFKGQNANGTWTLNVADTGAADIGTLNRFSLIIAGSTCALPPATVTNVSSSVANATYGVGATIPVVVSFSTPVNVTGTPQLALNSGGVATYASGSGSNSLTFTYAVSAGQSSADLDYTSSSALTGTFDNAILTLPAPGAVGSLGANKDIVIDAPFPPDLTVTKSHVGNFSQGQIGATYIVTVNNIGVGDKRAAATVTVTDNAPAGLSVTAMSGSGWTCATLPTCTRTDLLAPGASYPAITVTVTVASNAASPLSNSVTVSTTAIEQDTTNNTATDSTVILVPPDMTITKTHVGNFSQGQVGATYSVIASNSGLGDKLAAAVVTVTDTPPTGLTITAMSGGGWVCTTLPTCTRSDVLIAGASYPPITVTVSVAANASSPKVNSVAVSTTALESNTGNNSATDATVIVVPPDLTVSKAHSGNFLQGQTGVTFTTLVTNLGAGDKLAGSVVTLTDTPPPGLNITAMSGIGWSCTTLPSCTRTDVLGAGFSYPTITITANVAGNAGSPLVNSVTVSSTSFDSNAGNNTATDSAVIITAPDLTVNKSHVGNFSLGQIGAKYTVVVTNSGAGDKVAGTLVTLTDTAPSGLTIIAMSGNGWTCAALPTCTRSDALASGVAYPSVTVTVNVAAAASSPQVNAVSVTTAATESNSVNNLGTDSTVIVTGTPGSLTVNKFGSGSGTVASQDGGINCGATCTFAYVVGSNILLTATPAAGSIFTGWLGPCSGTGTCTVPISGAATVSATFALSTIGTRILDIDASTAYLPESDGMLVLRYLFGLRGTALTTGVLGTGAVRTGDPQMSTYLQDILPLLDVDGNGQVDALTDGLMIMRKLLGQTGTAITQGALGVGATRNTADIEAYIQTLKPP